MVVCENLASLASHLRCDSCDTGGGGMKYQVVRSKGDAPYRETFLADDLAGFLRIVSKMIEEEAGE